MTRTLFVLIFLLTLPLRSMADVPYVAHLQDETNGEDWLSYSGGYRSQRFSPLSQINTSNVDQLKVIWAYQMQPTGISGAGLQESTPLVSDGILYLTESPSSVSAIDAVSGRLLWHLSLIHI